MFLYSVSQCYTNFVRITDGPRFNEEDAASVNSDLQEVEDGPFTVQITSKYSLHANFNILNKGRYRLI